MKTKKSLGCLYRTQETATDCGYVGV